jgi:hypothetical protein
MSISGIRRISAFCSHLPITYHHNAPYSYDFPTRTAHELQRRISKTMAVVFLRMRDGG